VWRVARGFLGVHNNNSYRKEYVLYGVEIYANTCRSYVDKLMKLNNKILRILQHKDRYYRNVDLYINYNTLPITELHEFYIICLIHKFMHHKHLLPRIYHNYFTENHKIHCYNTRNKNDLYLSAVSHSFGSRAIYFKGCTLLNQLPDLTFLSRPVLR